MIIAVDFDGTLCENKYPDIGSPNNELIQALIKYRALGNKIILWTCREGENLTNAIIWCKKNNLHFDAINDNLKENKEFFKNNSRKVYANFYIDDKNCHINDFIKLNE